MSQNETIGFHVEDEGSDQETFACNTCDYKNKSKKTVKSHVTRQHVKKQTTTTAADDVNVNDDDDEPNAAALAALDRWDKPREDDEEGGGDKDEVVEKEDEVVVIDDATGQEGNLGKAVERIKYLEELLRDKEKVMKVVETELETARDLANIADGKAASLETENEHLKIDNENLKAEAKKYKRISLNLNDDLNKMKAGGIDPEIEMKMKIQTEEIKVKTKAAENSEKSKKDLAKKLEEEVSARAKAEADCAKFSKMVDILQNKTESDKNKPKSKALCRDINKTGGCPRAGSCKFHHPTLAKENKGIDCHHWMNGRCKFEEKNCKFKHDPSKKSVNVSKRKRSEDEEQHKEANAATNGQQDFMLSMARALAQGSTGEARMGSGTEPAQGLESQRNIRPRMVSPNSSARGMEDQRSRSYADVVDPRRRES